jgi:hypothetical protein
MKSFGGSLGSPVSIASPLRSTASTIAKPRGLAYDHGLVLLRRIRAGQALMRIAGAG